MKIFAVVDTNVIIAALLSKNFDSATVKIIRNIYEGQIVPLYHDKIIAEYIDVLSRDKFPISKEVAKKMIDTIKNFGEEIGPSEADEVFVDEDDRIFYEVMMTRRNENSYLITGNKKHYPSKNFVVSPAEMIYIIENCEECF